MADREGGFLEKLLEGRVLGYVGLHIVIGQTPLLEQLWQRLFLL